MATLLSGNGDAATVSRLGAFANARCSPAPSPAPRDGRSARVAGAVRLVGAAQLPVAAVEQREPCARSYGPAAARRVGAAGPLLIFETGRFVLYYKNPTRRNRHRSDRCPRHDSRRPSRGRPASRSPASVLATRGPSGAAAPPRADEHAGRHAPAARAPAQRAGAHRDPSGRSGSAPGRGHRPGQHGRGRRARRREQGDDLPLVAVEGAARPRRAARVVGDGPRTERHGLAARRPACARQAVGAGDPPPALRAGDGRARHGGAVRSRVRGGLPPALRRAAPRADAGRVRARDRAGRSARRPRCRGRARPDLRPDLPPPAARPRRAHRALRRRRDRPRAGRDPRLAHRRRVREP